MDCMSVWQDGAEKKLQSLTGEVLTQWKFVCLFPLLLQLNQVLYLDH